MKVQQRCLAHMSLWLRQNLDDAEAFSTGSSLVGNVHIGWKWGTGLPNPALLVDENLAPSLLKNPVMLPFALSLKASAPPFSLHSCTPGFPARLAHVGNTHTHGLCPGCSPAWMLFPHLGSWPISSSPSSSSWSTIFSLRPLLIAPAPQAPQDSWAPFLCSNFP